MYTEEEEFDYDAYLDENDDDNSNKPFFNKTFITKALLIVLLLILIIFLFFSITNSFKKKDDKKETPVDSSLVFNNNMATLKTLAENYFFKKGNAPKNTKDKVNLTVKELINKKLITEVLDYDKKACSYNTSYISMTKNKNDYMLEIYLNCPSNDEKRVYYYDLNYNCLTCNGENYVSKDDDGETEENNNSTNNNNNSNNNNNNSNNNSNDSNNNNSSNVVPVCEAFGEWTTEYKDDANLDRQSRVLVKGYKNTLKFGEWSNETTEPLEGSDTLQVAYEVRPTQVSELGNWSKKTTSKPAAKEGREIKSWTEKQSYTTKSCKNETYTVNRSTWDNNALKCTSSGIGKVTCTYEKEVCSNVKKYKNVKYYQYRDMVTETRNATYYRSRTIERETVYTDYILEALMPSGYTKVDGSELTQYRYRTKCVNK